MTLSAFTRCWFSSVVLRSVWSIPPSTFCRAKALNNVGVLPERLQFSEVSSGGMKGSRVMRSEMSSGTPKARSLSKESICLQCRPTWGSSKGLMGSQGPERLAIDTQLIQIQPEPGGLKHLSCRKALKLVCSCWILLKGSRSAVRVASTSLGPELVL
ncbi:unnamed protein product [Symbiodinium necroappetens]|uniref:Secreted protein n=1 Tax=Symbiodinium necroappetens TaxID=1628268 RepID=A0A812KN88_9DINO|nr:unnamed protein product [Symbiodinium necroappetens]